jgi:hypothetical protein
MPNTLEKPVAHASLNFMSWKSPGYTPARRASGLFEQLSIEGLDPESRPAGRMTGNE